MDPPPPARRRQRAGAGRDLGLGLLRDLGAAGPRRARAAHAAVAVQRGLPLHVAARDHRGRRAGARAARDLRGRAGLGALLPDRVRADALAHAVGGRASRTGSWPAATARSTRCALEKGYRVWGADITPDETPYEGGVGFCVKLDKPGGFIGRDALAEAGEADPVLCCLTLEDARSVALGNEPVRCAGEVVRPGDERRLRLQRRALDRLRLPARRALVARAPAWPWRSSAAGSRARWPRSRCSTRAASGSRSARRPVGTPLPWRETPWTGMLCSAFALVSSHILIPPSGSTTFTIRQGRAPRRMNRCLTPGASRGSTCSAGLSRRTLLVAALVFAGALGVGYVVSSPGSAEPAPEPVGTTAVPLDVPAASGGEASLGKVEGLPALARQPAPPPATAGACRGGAWRRAGRARPRGRGAVRAARLDVRSRAAADTPAPAAAGPGRLRRLRLSAMAGRPTPGNR